MREIKDIPGTANTFSAVSTLVKSCHARAWNNGWWHSLETGELLPPDVPLKLCLIHSEISEALEAHRKDKNDDHLKDRKGLEVELADAVIRIFDMAGGLGLDLSGALVEKLAYNDTRADHKPENRAKEGGKKV